MNKVITELIKHVNVSRKWEVSFEVTRLRINHLLGGKKGTGIIARDSWVKSRG